MTTTVDFTEQVGKKVILQVERGGEVADIEGTIEAATDVAVLLKPKGKSAFDLIELGTIRGHELIVAAPRALKSRKVKPVEVGAMRKHLLDMHGYTLSAVNGATEESASQTHDTIDHSDLGHHHVAPESSGE